ncbi:hypothetical protein BJ998_009270 [Kutzneria kofuensis]|jgi:hypothetical protein|uniref:Uncharacterized protein n=1 Tax=Kutzneria kofuensis TaxID=103725 RepID=A0A7W9NMX9_9PSEU|nr:hypothetical protein [Kutzneria kofuensis]
MAKLLRRLPIIGALLRNRALRKKKRSPDDDGTMYPLY